MEQPGRVVTADVLSSLVGQAWPHSFNPLNVMSGFRKCRIQPFNPGEVSNRALTVSRPGILKLYHTESVTSSGCLRSSPSSNETSPVLSEILTLPKPPARRKKGASKGAVCITEDEVLQGLKKKQAEKARQEALKAERRVEREQQREEKKILRSARKGKKNRSLLLRSISHLKLVHSVKGGKTSQKRGHDGSVVTSAKDGSTLIV